MTVTKETFQQMRNDIKHDAQVMAKDTSLSEAEQEEMQVAYQDSLGMIDMLEDLAPKNARVQAGLDQLQADQTDVKSVSCLNDLLNDENLHDYYQIYKKGDEPVNLDLLAAILTMVNHFGIVV